MKIKEMTSKIWKFPQLPKTLHDHQTAVEETAVSCCLIAIAKSLEITHFHVSLSESPCTGVSIALEESTTLGEIGEKIARSMDLSCAQKACIIMTITDDARNLSTSVWKVEIERYEGDGLR